MATVVVLGSGIMATALSFPLADNGHKVKLVGTHLDHEIIESIKETGIHPRLGLKVPEGTEAYYLEEAEEAFKDAEFVMSGVNSYGAEWVGEQFSRLIKPNTHIISIAKGIRYDEDGNFKFLPDVFMSYLPQEVRDSCTLTVIVGPSIAGELAVHRHTAVCFGSKDIKVAEMWRDMFETDYYHIWPSDQYEALELCACTKNCYAFGAGFMHGTLNALGKQDNPYVNFNYGAAVFAQAAIEMYRWCEVIGADPKVSLGLPGIGDCFVTSMGGRNVKAGTLVGEGMTFSEAQAKMPGVTLEGATAIVYVGEALTKLTERGVCEPEDFPLLRALYEVVGFDKPVDIPFKKFFEGAGYMVN